MRAVILTGEGRGFCSGADLRGGSGERDFRTVLEREYNPLIRAIRELPKPVIAAVNGVAAGAGVSLALACDLVYAAEEATLHPGVRHASGWCRTRAPHGRWSGPWAVTAPRS